MSDFLNPHLTRPAVRWTSGDALPAVEQTGPAAPLLVDSTTGRLLVDTEANLTADLSLIESKQDVTNAILTTTAADVATVKGYANVTKGSGVVDANTQRVTLATDGPGVSNLASIATNTSRVPGFALPSYDYISLTYTSGNVTGVVYKSGGASGTTVATLTLAYSGSDLVSVTKS